MVVKRTLGIVSISDKKSYSKIYQSFEAGPAEMHPLQMIIFTSSIMQRILNIFTNRNRLHSN